MNGSTYAGKPSAADCYALAVRCTHLSVDTREGCVCEARFQHGDTTFSRVFIASSTESALRQCSDNQEIIQRWVQK